MLRKKHKAPSATDRQALSEHLFYEVQMTFFLAGRLDRPVSSPVDTSLRNAQIEALTVHMRQLAEFFWGERTPLAADYFPRGRWESLRPARPPGLADVAPAFVQLGYDRNWSPPSDRAWDLVTQAHGLVPTVICFAETVDPAQFAPGYVNGMRLCAELFARGEAGAQAA